MLCSSCEEAALAITWNLHYVNIVLFIIIWLSKMNSFYENDHSKKDRVLIIKRLLHVAKSLINNFWPVNSWLQSPFSYVCLNIIARFFSSITLKLSSRNYNYSISTDHYSYPILNPLLPLQSSDSQPI